MLEHMLARRTLLRSSLLLVPGLGEALLHAQETASMPHARTTYFSATDASEIESIAAEVIPTDDSPGAKEAGVIFFIDRALATFDSDKRELYRQGLRDTQVQRRVLFPTSTSIAALTSSQRIDLLATIDKTPFFETLREHTVIGFFAAPNWNGNRDKVGWKLIAFDDRGTFQPPFGYYDAPGNAQ